MCIARRLYVCCIDWLIDWTRKRGRRPFLEGSTGTGSGSIQAANFAICSEASLACDEPRRWPAKKRALPVVDPLQSLRLG